jgi:hypothetical protein
MLEKQIWNMAKRNVNKASNTLHKYGFGYSPTNGLVGNTRGLSKRDNKKLTAAADTMHKFEAAYYPNHSKSNNNNSEELNISAAHYDAANLADHEEVQEKAISQSKSSMELRAIQTFIQRQLYAPRMQSHPNRRVLGITAEQANKWSAETEALFRQDRELKSWDESLKNSYDQLGDMALKQYLSIGEFFAVTRAYNNDPERPTNVSVQLFNPLQIQSPHFAYGNYYYNIQTNNSCGQIVNVSYASYHDDITAKGNYIEKGIEFNNKDQEIAIFLAPTKFGEPYIRVPFKNKNGFTQIIHGFVQTEPGQKRGLPDSCYAWHEFMNTTDLKKFEMQSARLSASVMGSVTADSNAQPGGNQGDLDKMGTSWVDNPSSIGALPEYKPPGYEKREINGGAIVLQNFTPGYKFTEHTTSRPNLNIPLFIEKNLEFTYTGTYGISVVLVKQRLDGSYNASKGVIDLSWKTGIEYYKDQFASDWSKVLYPIWLNGKVASGEIICAGWEDLKKRYAWSSMSVVTPAKPSLNPLQEAKAADLNISNLLTNGELEAQKMNGTSFEENAERAMIEQQLKKKVFPPEIIEPIKKDKKEIPENA